MKILRTKRLNAILETLKPEEKPASSEVGDQWIQHYTAIRLGKELKIPLSDLLMGTGVFFDQKEQPRKKSEEYLKLMTDLKKREDEENYKALIGRSYSNGSDTINFKSISDEVNEQLTTVFNVLVSITAVGWAFWYWCSSWPLGGRILISLFAGIFTGIAEAVVYSGYLRRAAEAKQNSRSPTVESKHVVKEVIFQNGKELVNTRDFNKETCEKQEPKVEEKLVLRQRRVIS